MSALKNFLILDQPQPMGPKLMLAAFLHGQRPDWRRHTTTVWSSMAPVSCEVAPTRCRTWLITMPLHPVQQVIHYGGKTFNGTPMARMVIGTPVMRLGT